MKILFMGMPGVGKGTYAQIMKEELGIPHISSGDLLRDVAKQDSDLGKTVAGIMKQGKLVSDDIMLEIIKQRIQQPDCEKGFILDGYPRTAEQAKMLNSLVEITHVLHFKADDEVIIDRLGGRLVCKGCKSIFHKTGNKPKVEWKCDHCSTELHTREDDKPHVVKQRLELDAEKSKPLLDHYNGEGLLVEIVINKPIHDIKDKVVKRIKDYVEGKSDSIGEIE